MKITLPFWNCISVIIPSKIILKLLINNIMRLNKIFYVSPLERNRFICFTAN